MARHTAKSHKIRKVEILVIQIPIFEIETEEIYSADYFGCVPVSNPADLSDDNALYDGAIYRSGRCF